MGITHINRGNERYFYLITDAINIDNGNGSTDDHIMLRPDLDVEVEDARCVYTEQTDSEGAASANVKIGTTVGGVDIVAATALEVSKSVGTATVLTIADGYVAAGELIAVRHTGVASTEGGEYKVQLRCRVRN